MIDGNTYAINRHLAEREEYDERQEALDAVKNLAEAEERIEELEARIAELEAKQTDLVQALRYMVNHAGQLERNDCIYWEATEIARAALAEITETKESDT